MAAFSIAPSESKWAAQYWKEGPKAAEGYCDQVAAVCAEIGRFLGNIRDQIYQAREDEGFVTPIHRSVVTGLPSLTKHYEEKQKRYEKDSWVTSLWTGKSHLMSLGRREPGRSPLHWRSFCNRFSSLKQLRAHVKTRMETHQMAHEDLLAVQKYLEKDSGSYQQMQHLIELHHNRYEKWKERNQLLDNGKIPLSASWSQRSDLMFSKIGQAQSDGFSGAGTVGTLFGDSPIDTTHPRLSASCLTSRASFSDECDDHGTKVAGVVHSVVPKAQLVSAETDMAVKGIVNWSGGYFVSAIEDSEQGLKKRQGELSYIKMKFNEYFDSPEDKLVIQSLGNQGVVVDQNERIDLNNREVIALSSRADHWIFVVNLEREGLYPNAMSNVPGKTYAPMTICSVGTDIYTTSYQRRYTLATGTSFSAPFVTGVALMIQGKFPDLSCEEIRSCLLKSAIPIILDEKGVPRLVHNRDLSDYPKEQLELSRAFYGVGLLDAKAAVEEAARVSANHLFERLWGPRA